MKNFLRLDGLSILSVQYMYIDYKDYLADSLLAQNHVSVRFENEFSRDDSSYRIILCKVKKKDTAGLKNPWNCYAIRCCFSDTTITWNSAIASWKHWNRIEVPHEEIICPDQQTE